MSGTCTCMHMCTYMYKYNMNTLRIIPTCTCVINWSFWSSIKDEGSPGKQLDLERERESVCVWRKEWLLVRVKLYVQCGEGCLYIMKRERVWVCTCMCVEGVSSWTCMCEPVLWSLYTSCENCPANHTHTHTLLPGTWSWSELGSLPSHIASVDISCWWLTDEAVEDEQWVCPFNKPLQLYLFSLILTDWC